MTATPARLSADEAAIRRRIDQYVEAICSMDIEKVTAIFAPALVSFDLEAPLQHRGAAAKGQNWARAFAAYQHPLRYEVRELVLSIGGELAFGHSLNRFSGTSKGGATADYWVRWTSCLRKIDGTWFITHDHVSVPLDLRTGQALRELVP